MKTIGYAPINYGKEYFEASLKSVEPHVDKFVVLYSETGSQGYVTDQKPPDTESELHAIASDVLGSKLVWDNSRYATEGQHRDAAFAFAEGYQVMLTLDSDEVIDSKELPRVIQEVYDGSHRRLGVNGYVNFWRSFSRACIDGFRPIRFFNLMRPSAGSQGEVQIPFYHFGCAQSLDTVFYKWQISAHRGELRPDWYYMHSHWEPGKYEWLHPASLTIWKEPEYFDKQTLPQILKDHPNFKKEIII